MREDEVIEAVAEWLRCKYPNKIVNTTKDVDLMVYEVTNDKVKRYVQVECKGEWEEFYKGLGQSLVYYVENGLIPTYLAVPHDYSKLERIKNMLKVLNLPIGLIAVQQNGEVEIMKEVEEIER